MAARVHLTRAHPSVRRANAVVKRALPSCRHRKAVVTAHNTIAIVCNRVVRRADKVNSYHNSVVGHHNAVVIVCNRVVRHADEVNSYNNRVVTHHNTIVIACNRICTRACKKKTIVDGVAGGVSGYAALTLPVPLVPRIPESHRERSVLTHGVLCQDMSNAERFYVRINKMLGATSYEKSSMHDPQVVENLGWHEVREKRYSKFLLFSLHAMPLVIF